MEALPVFLNVRSVRCLVAGGGEVAFRKARLLARAQAELHIVAPHAGDRMLELLQEHGGRLDRREIREEDFEGAQLAIAATDDPEVNENVSRWARERGIPVNVVDQPALCTFYMPAIVDRSPVVVAISSSGTSPVLTRSLKEMNEVMMPARIDRLAHLLGSMRGEVKDRIADFAGRTAFWENVLDSEVPELVYAGREEEAKTALEGILAGGGQQTGEVWLVGAGPGDPDLLTLRALRLLYRADVVLYDRLVSKEILARIRPDAELIHVGKGPEMHSVDQYTINDMLIDYAREGRRVLRLKGGDPFIFGRGGEELTTLAEAGINFQIVPGITAASGCAAYAGIPLTHRDHAHSVQFVTGHLKDGSLDLDWPALIRPQQTLVFYMGLKSLPIVCEQLQRHGMPADTPAAVVSQGTTREQQVAAGNLGNLPDVATGQGIKAPAIIIVGEVVSLRDSFAWFQR
ncbi:MAG: siroheme synthase CysG [Gammaproteobacteria bacterium]|nr:siroheme synthase CysG [Gammaproteobacteria bacterium]